MLFIGTITSSTLKTNRHYSKLNTKTTHTTLALLALLASPALAVLPYSEAFVYDGSESVDLVIKANSTKVASTSEGTKVNISAITVDEDYIADEGNMGEVVFARGEFTNSGNLYAHQIIITTNTYYFEENAEVDVSGATSFTNNGTIITKNDNPWPDEVPEFDPYLSLSVQAGAVLTNDGAITAHTIIQGEGSRIIAEDGSQFNYRVDVGSSSSAGILQINGAITMNAELWAESGSIVFMESSSLNMMNNAIHDLDNVELVYMVKGTVDETAPVLVNGFILSTKVDYSWEVTVKGTEGGSYVTSMAKLVPEPTTATLSLLALASLAAHRRRK